MSYVGKITKGSATHLVGSTLYGTCSTAAGTAAKVVSCADFDALITGVTIHVFFGASNTASNPTLNVNSTGAKDIFVTWGTASNLQRRVGTDEAHSWRAGSVVSFTYDGTRWIMNSGVDENSSVVTGVKGNSESSYHTGQVNLTAANVGAAPTSHASSSDTYGKGTSSDYGHVKLSDSTSSTSAAASGGTAATPKAVSDALTAACNYADNVVTVDNYIGNDSTNPVQNTVIFVALATKAPTNHASTGTTYGKGDGSNYGHVKLSDSTSSTSAAASGVAATPKAVKDALAAAKAYADTAAAGALSYEGTVTAESALLNTAIERGQYWVVAMPDSDTTSITIGGETYEAGDMVFVRTSGTYTTSAALGAAVDAVQANITALTTTEIDALWTAA